MEPNLALDLKVARRRSGLSQADVAHLLGVHRTRVSKLESGTYLPNAEELATLSLIYRKSFLQLGTAAMPALCRRLEERLETLPNRESYAAGTSDKAVTLSSLTKRLAAPSFSAYDD